MNLGSPGSTVALLGRARARRRCVFGEGVQQLLDAEIVDRRAEEHRRLLAAQIGVEVERVARAAHQFDLLAQLVGQVAEQLVQARVVQALDLFTLGDAAAVLRVVQMHRLVAQVDDALEALAHADRPGDRGALDLQHVLDLVQQLDRVAALAVQLVDEGQDRRVAQAADLHQLDGAFLDALGDVDHHQRRIDRGQGAVGVLGEILVARGVEQIDDLALVRELHDRGGHRDAALLLQLHPVGGRVARRLAPLDRAGQLDRAAEQQQLLGQRRLAGVRVRNDGEGATLRAFCVEVGHGNCNIGKRAGLYRIAGSQGLK